MGHSRSTSIARAGNSSKILRHIRRGGASYGCDKPSSPQGRMAPGEIECYPLGAFREPARKISNRQGAKHEIANCEPFRTGDFCAGHVPVRDDDPRLAQHARCRRRSGSNTATSGRAGCCAGTSRNPGSDPFASTQRRATWSTPPTISAATAWKQSRATDESLRQLQECLKYDKTSYCNNGEPPRERAVHRSRRIENMTLSTSRSRWTGCFRGLPTAILLPFRAAQRRQLSQ